ncbi:uncharacterized protein [Coffea arabica]|uniref:AT-rich interactive domain-containing protein 5-like n=1 Tax=Coffea arabica TaxID=13443 RepID=A0ABM4VTN3_COFAR
MDKSDVEMEDAGKMPQEGLSHETKSDDALGTPDAHVNKPQGQQLPSHQTSPELQGNAEAAADPLAHEEHGEPNVQLEVDRPTNIKAKGSDLNMSKIEAEDGSFAGGSEVDGSNGAKAQSEEPNKDNKEVDTTEEPNEDNPSGALEEPNKEATNKAEAAEEEEQLVAETRMKVVSSAAKEETSPENSNEVEDAVDSLFEDQKAFEKADEPKNHTQNGQLPFQLPVSEVPPKKKEAADEAPQGEGEEMVKGSAEDFLENETEDTLNGHKEPGVKSVLPATVSDDNVKLGDKTATRITKPEAGDAPAVNKRQPATPDLPMKYSSKRSGSHSGEASKHVAKDAQMLEGDDGTPEEQAAFVKELETFYRERGMDFKPPKFYGQPLNLCKLWRSVIRLGGYDLVTGSKLWRQVGESFHPPKTCTTVSWTFRIFYEKSLLEYERYKIQSGELQFPVAAVPESAGADNEGNGYQASGSGRARRDAAARAMQGWHVQRLFGYGEVGEPIVKDKSPNNMQKRENKVKSIGSLKQKRTSEMELPVKAQRTETYRQLVTTVVDVGPPADWVKINVRETKDCFEVYALVPGLLREEVRVQSDPAGRLVITGQPEQPDNPWGITAFKKVVSLPARIDPLQTSAVVSLHGRLYVRVPFEQANT